MEDTIVILGNGFDCDWGLKYINSIDENGKVCQKNIGLDFSYDSYCKYHLCPACNPKREIQLWSGFENYIRQKVLTWYKEYRTESFAIEINEEWRAFKSVFSFFFQNQLDKQNVQINKDSCAYAFLNNFSDKSKVYTFNYTYPYEFDVVGIHPKKEFTFVHGRFSNKRPTGMTMYISYSKEMILGIDYKRIPNMVKTNKYFKPLIKHLYADTNIERDIINARNVIFFGLSMGITDSDYFDEFFAAITKGISICEVIYYITLNESGFDTFKENIRKMGYDYSSIESQVKITPIYTSQGVENEDFKSVLSFI